LIYLIGKHVSRARSLIVTFDAIGLAIFSVTGPTFALGAGATYPAALLMGALTAGGGGLMRDAVASENPAIFTGTDLYLLPALFGAGGALLADATGILNNMVSLIIAGLAFVFRMLAWKLQWRVPQPMRQWSYRETERKMKKLPSVFRKPD
ncbi:MAG: TRIC cation channel family protein, partial [Brevibacterium aurantiacum]|nr:TRIC cation channel family protein [Brevibacterium aurantiacum]